MSLPGCHHPWGYSSVIYPNWSAIEELSGLGMNNKENISKFSLSTSFSWDLSRAEVSAQKIHPENLSAKYLQLDPRRKEFKGLIRAAGISGIMY